jgi:hypothetical protein
MDDARFNTLTRFMGPRTSRRLPVGLAATGLLSIAVPDTAAARCSAPGSGRHGALGRWAVSAGGKPTPGTHHAHGWAISGTVTNWKPRACRSETILGSASAVDSAEDGASRWNSMIEPSTTLDTTCS